VKRVYVPTTLAVWQRLVANGSMFQVSGTAFAVTPGRVLCRAAQRAKHLLIEGMQRSALQRGASD
jgi:hypothetical protein